MNSIDQTAFLWFNLSVSAPDWLLAVARVTSLQLPHWMVAATLALALAGRAEWRAQAWRVLLSMVLAAGAASLLKRGLQFPRPFTLGLGTLWVPHGVSAGFPSAHSATAMAFAVSAALAPMRWPARAGLRRRAGDGLEPHCPGRALSVRRAGRLVPGHRVCPVGAAPGCAANAALAVGPCQPQLTRQIFSMLVPPGAPIGSPQVMA